MTDTKQHVELTDRARQVLRILIREHVRTGRPVGSRRLSKLYPEKLSPATLRNVMADLEEAGYVTQPHTSAGRVPTQEGYRFYVAVLLRNTTLGGGEVARIRRILEEESNPEELMSKASRLLSRYTDNIGFVLSPPVSRAALKHVEFVKFSNKRVLVILVTKSGLVQHQLISVEDEMTQSELDQSGRYLVSHFSGKNLLEIRAELLRRLSLEEALFSRLKKNVLLLGSLSLLNAGRKEREETAVFLGGTARIMRKPELADVRDAAGLLQALEEKEKMVRIINECLRKDVSGPTVSFDVEKHIPELRNWTIISSPYPFSDDRTCAGRLGILGPARMEYEKAIGLVDCMARLFGQIFTH